MKKKLIEYFKHLNFIKKNKFKKHLFNILKKDINTDDFPKEYVLTQIVYDYNYIFKLATFTQSYAGIKKLRIIAYDTYFSWNFILQFLNLFTTNGFQFVYGSFTDKIYRNINIYKKFTKKNIDKDYYEIINKLKKPADILNIKINDIEVGDLIYDTYLRFYKKPTITSINKDVKKVIMNALNIYYNFNNLFIDKDIKIFVTSLTSYIHHGIPTRMCLKKNIPVYALSSNNYIVQKIENHFPYHSIDYTNFSFKDVQNNSYDVKKIFESRFDGVIDSGISYMRKSSYSQIDNTSLLKPLFYEKNRNVVIYIHDFYDSPHINRNLYFRDLYHYIDSVIINLINTETNFFIKPHPNSVYNSDEILKQLIKSYNKPNVHLLSNRISNSDLVNLRPNLIVTARGTITIEMAYMGIPVVALYDNPYVKFNFVHTCYSLQEYYDIINGFMQPIIDFNKDEILSFYYQYFLEKTINDEFNVFSNIFESKLLSDEKIFNPDHPHYTLVKKIFTNSKNYINDYLIKNNL
jgi:hypothetical protein